MGKVTGLSMAKPKNNKEATENLMNAMVVKHAPRIKFHVAMLIGFSAFLMFAKNRSVSFPNHHLQRPASRKLPGTGLRQRRRLANRDH